MHDLLGVHIFHGVEQLGGYLAHLILRHIAAFDSRFERLAVHILHHYAVAQFAHRIHAYGAADVGMVELQPYLELLHERLTIYRGVGEVGLQAFQHIALAVTNGRENAVKARFRYVSLAYVRESAVMTRRIEVALVTYIRHESRCRLFILIIHCRMSLIF